MLNNSILTHNIVDRFVDTELYDFADFASFATLQTVAQVQLFSFSLHLQSSTQMTIPSVSDKKNILLNPATWVVAGICVLTFVCFSYSLNNLFTNWDDDVYVTNDKYIKAFTAENLKAIFTEDITKNNYHPLTMLSLAINYHFAGLEPRTYYLTNILIHIANVILVFLLTQALFKRMKNEELRMKNQRNILHSSFFILSSFCALWFGVHPMRVESVSWLAERKDVLYAFFYFLGLLTYLRYKDEKKTIWYILTMLCFIASCLSKPMAVVFPLSMLAIDFLLYNPLRPQTEVVKKGAKSKSNNPAYSTSQHIMQAGIRLIPFFLASLFFGGYAYYRQNATGAIAPFAVLTLAERFMYAGYGFVMYVSKLFNPTHLSTFYPYPYRFIDGTLPWIYYAAPFIAVLMVAVPLTIITNYELRIKKHSSKSVISTPNFRVIVFGFGFFFVNIVFVLQFISCGAAIMADRYSYVSYFGLLFMLAYFLGELMNKFPLYKISFILLLSLLTAGLSYTCYQRTKVWHNAETLLGDAIQKYPYGALLSYKWLGNYYLDSMQFDHAEKCYRMLTMLRSADAKVYDNLGTVLKYKNEYTQALGAYDTSLAKGGNIYRTLLDRSSCLSDLGDTTAAMQDFITAVKMNPEAGKNFADAGFTEVQNRQYPDAIGRYDILLKITPNNPYYLFYRGVCEFGEHRLTRAASDFKKALVFNNPETSMPSAYNLSVVCDSLQNYPDAIKYAIVAQQFGYKLDADYISKLKAKNPPK